MSTECNPLDHDFRDAPEQYPQLDPFSYERRTVMVVRVVLYCRKCGARR